MPALDKIKKYRNNPCVLIVNGINSLGIELTKLLIEQGTLAIIIDDYSINKKRKLKNLTESDNFIFIDKSGIDSLFDNINRLDYVFYLETEYKSNEKISTSQFLQTSNFIDKILKNSLKKKSKFLLASSLDAHKQLTNIPSFQIDESLGYTDLEVIRYCENLTWEYYNQSGIDARIIRIGSLLGEDIDIDENSILHKFIKSAVDGQKIEIEGDGLDNLFYVHVKDASYGLIKAMFSKDTKGKIYSLYIPRDITILNLAYKILDLEPRADGIDFVDKKETQNVIYKPVPNLTKIGWKTKISLERALAGTIEGFLKEYKNEKVSYLAKVEGNEQDSSENPNSKPDKDEKSFKTVFSELFKDKSKDDSNLSILDNAMYSSYKKSLEKPTEFKRENKIIDKGNNKINDGNIFKKISFFFKSLTLGGVVKYFLIFLSLFLLYFFIFIPSVRLMYYSGYTYYSLNKSEQNLQKEDYIEAEKYLKRSVDSLNSIKEELNNLYIVKPFKINNKIQSLTNIVDKYIDKQNNAYLMLNWKNSLRSFMKVNLENTNFNNEVQNQTIDSKKEAFLNVQNAYNKLLQTYSQEDINYDFSNIPLISGKLLDFTNKTNNLYEIILEKHYIDELAYVLQGFEGDKTQLFVLLDDRQKLPQGGEINDMLIIEYQNGVVKSIEDIDIDSIDISNYSNIYNNTLANLKQFNIEEMSFNDLSLVYNDKDFQRDVEYIINYETKKNIDDIVFLNYASLLNLSSDFENKTVLSKVKNYDNEGNLLTSFFNEIINEINNKENLEKYISLFEVEIYQKNIRFISSDKDFSEAYNRLVSKRNDNFETLINFKDLRILAIENDDLQLSTNLDIRVEDTKLTQNYYINILDNSKFEGYLIFKGINSNIINIKINEGQSDVLFNKDNICIVFVQKGKSQIEFDIVTEINDKKNLSFYYQKNSQVDEDYEISIKLPDDYNIKTFPVDFNLNDGFYQVEGFLSRDKIWTFSSDNI